MSLIKINEESIRNKGVLNIDDEPKFDANELKRKFEELVRTIVIPAFNENAGNTYDKAEVAAVISKAVFESGAADMMSFIYDKNNRNEDFFEFAQNLYEDIVQKEEKTFFVNANAANEGEGTAENPFKTIAKVFEALPVILNENINVVVAQGTYGAVKIEGYAGKGSINISAESGKVVFRETHVKNCSCNVLFSKIEFNSWGEKDVVVSSCACVELDKCNFFGEAFEGIWAKACKMPISGCRFRDKIIIISANSGAVIHFKNNTGTGNEKLAVCSGGIILTEGTLPQLDSTLPQNVAKMFY